MKVKLLGAFCILLIFYFSMVNWVVMHENAHKEVFRIFGVDSKIVYGPMMVSGTTEYESGYCNDSCKAVQANAEVIGYNSQTVITSLWMVLGALLIFFMMREGK